MWVAVRGAKELLPPRIFEFQSFEHEDQQLVPAIKTDVARERSDVVVEVLAPGKAFSDQSVSGIKHLKHCMEQECDKVQAKQGF